MRWDEHTTMAFGGLAVLIIGSVMLFEESSASFVPVLGMVTGVAALALANHERLKLRIAELETRIARAEWRQR
jgi:hypothetical protein